MGNECVTKAECASYLANVPAAGRNTCVTSCRFKDDDGRCYDACVPAFMFQEQMDGYVRCAKNSDSFSVFHGSWLVRECPPGYLTNENGECERQTCYNGQYHRLRKELRDCPAKDENSTSGNMGNTTDAESTGNSTDSADAQHLAD